MTPNAEVDLGGPIAPPSSLPEQVYDRIQAAIFKSALLPGTPISEPQMSAQLGVSRTVLREALVRLEVEGHVGRGENGRWRVSALEPKDVADIYECRGTLEGLAASLAAERADPAIVARMGREMVLVRECRDLGRMEEAADHSTIFHDLIVEASGNQKVATLMNMLRPHVLQNRSRMLTHKMREGSFVDQNEALLRAIEEGDATAADTIARQIATDDMKAIVSSELRRS